MLLRYSFRLEVEASCIERAVTEVLASGAHTRDLARSGEPTISTSEMGERVAAAAARLADATKPAAREKSA
jgi:3-isopropylmalate dehydrogenase